MNGREGGHAGVGIDGWRPPWRLGTPALPVGDSLIDTAREEGPEQGVASGAGDGDLHLEQRSMDFDLDASRAEANRLLAEAGWGPHPVWGSYAKGTLVAGLQPDGQAFHVKDWAAILPSHPHYGPDTPDEPHEAARWLIAKFGPASVAVNGMVTRETSGEHSTQTDALDLGSDILAAEEEIGEDPDALQGPAQNSPPPSEPTEPWDQPSIDDQAAVDAPIDADFTEPEPTLTGEDLNLPALTEELNEEGQGGGEGSDGPIAYAASDFDGLIREKLGRVGQIARALKAELQEGWGIAEFRSLQNHIQRIERGEAPDDHDARERFFAISERSQAMSRVETARDAHEAALDAIGQARDYAAAQAYDPEQGWE